MENGGWVGKQALECLNYLLLCTSLQAFCCTVLRCPLALGIAHRLCVGSVIDLYQDSYETQNNDQRLLWEGMFPTLWLLTQLGNLCMCGWHLNKGLGVSMRTPFIGRELHGIVRILLILINPYHIRSIMLMLKRRKVQLREDNSFFKAIT